MAVFRFFKMAAVRYLEFVIRVFEPPTKCILVVSVLFCSYGATMEAGMLLHSTALRPVSCTGQMRITGVRVKCMYVCV